MSQWSDEAQERWRKNKRWMIPGLFLGIAIMVATPIVAPKLEGETASRPSVSSGEFAEPGQGDYDPSAAAQEVAREVCSTASQAQMAREFGVPDDTAAVVEAYGEGSTEPARAASEQGCLEGLSE